MTSQEAKRALEVLDEFNSLCAHFDESEYTRDQLRQFGEEGVTIATNALRALRTPWAKRKLSKSDYASKRRALPIALREAQQTVKDNGG